MSQNESIVEDAALAMPRAILTPTLSQKEREQREAIRRPADAGPAITEEAPAVVVYFATAQIEKRLKP